MRADEQRLGGKPVRRHANQSLIVPAAVFNGRITLRYYFVQTVDVAVYCRLNTLGLGLHIR